MKISISNKIVITNPPANVVEILKKTLTIPNPLYYKLMNATGNYANAFYGTPEEFTYYHFKNNSMLIPRGMKSRLLTGMDKLGIKYELEEEYINIKL